MDATDETQFTDIIYALASIGRVCFSAQASGLYRSDDGGISWESAYKDLELTEPLPTLAVAVPPNFEHEGSLFAGVGGGILRSASAGRRWEQAFFPAPPATITTFCISPNYEQDGQIFAGTLDDGVFYTRDRGLTWQAGNFGLLDLAIFALAASPNFAQDRTLYAGTQTGIFYSTNGGRAWKETDLEDTAVFSLAVSPDFDRDRVIFAGTEASGLLYSADAGKTWQRVGEKHFTEPINALLLSPQYPHKPGILALHGDQLLRSTDNGQSWQEALAGKQVTAIHLAEDAKVYTGLHNGEVIISALF